MLPRFDLFYYKTTNGAKLSVFGGKGTIFGKISVAFIFSLLNQGMIRKVDRVRNYSFSA